ncbi:MAG TPA: ABC transporter substrate-binding protein [Beijerinckiaceae bacterium]|jgi:NitT/TauT family transport system substrate-binding protein|nr:ABC transporter substrate-binding protein [Beijerinckiaceae bacterium]
MMTSKMFGRLLVAASVAVLAFAAQAQTGPEKPNIKLGVGGKALLYYLPLTIAEQKGFFKDEGLNVEIQDFAGGSRSLQALVGGSVDVVTGAYEHTIRMQAKGQDIRAVLELGRFPGIAVAVKKGVKWDGPADFKGMKIGVTAPGSSTNMLMNFIMAKSGLAPSDAAYIGIGSAQSALAAIQKGEIQAISHLEPVLSFLERSGDVRIVYDTRTEEGTRALFGGSNPAAVVYMKADFAEKSPRTTQAVVNALYKALVWLKTASPADVAATVPEQYLLGDKELYMLAVKNSLPSYSQTGLIPREGMQSTLDMLVKFDPEMKDAKVDLGQTFDDRFAKKAAGAVK